MKKLLTVLLVIAVMFTFSFGSAFAMEDYTSGISDGYFETLWANYVKVTNNSGGDVVAIESYDVDKAVVAGFKAEAKTAYDDYMDNVAKDYVSTDAEFATAMGSERDKAKAFRLAVAKAQYDADKTDALTKLGTVPTYNYSTKVMSDAAATKAQTATSNEVKFEDKDYTYQKAAEKLVEHFKGLVEDTDDFNADVSVAAYKKAAEDVAAVLATALVPVCIENTVTTATGTVTKIVSTGAYDLTVAYTTLSNGEVDDETPAKNYVTSDATNDWSSKAVDADEKTDDAKIAAVKAMLAADYAKFVVDNPNDTEYADKWLKVANVLAENKVAYENIAKADKALKTYEYKAEKMADLEDFAAKYGAEKDANGQLVRDAAKVQKALEDGLFAIAKAGTSSEVGTPTGATEKAAVNAAYNAATAKILAAKTKAAEERLAFVKESAKKAMELTVSDAVADETYYEAELNDVKKYVETYTAKVEAADDEAEVKDAYKEFTTKLKGVKTAKALKEEYKRVMDGDNTSAVNTVYSAAASYVNYFNGDSSKDAGEMLDDSTLKDKVADMIGKSGVRTQKEIKALKDEGVKIAQALPTVDAVKAAKKAVKAAIDALPTKATIADLAAVQAASDALAAYNDLTTPGNVDVTAYNSAITNIVNAYNSQFAQQVAKVSETDEAAIKAALADIDAALDALKKLEDANYSDVYMKGLKTKLNGYLDKIRATEKKAVEDAIKAIPLNVTEADKATVVKARELYDAYVAKYNDYEHLYAPETGCDDPYTHGYAAGDINIDELTAAETVLGLNAVDPAELVKGLKITAKSTAKKGSITVKWTVKGEADIDGFEVWKSTKHSKGYKKAFTTTKKTYKNSKGLKKGTRYYYKVRAYKVIDGVKVTSDWSNKARRVAK